MAPNPINVKYNNTTLNKEGGPFFLGGKMKVLLLLLLFFLRKRDVYMIFSRWIIVSRLYRHKTTPRPNSLLLFPDCIFLRSLFVLELAFSLFSLSSDDSHVRKVFWSDESRCDSSFLFFVFCFVLLLLLSSSSVALLSLLYYSRVATRTV